MKFTDFIGEMAIEQGISGKRSRKYDWDNFIKKKQ